MAVDGQNSIEDLGRLGVVGLCSDRLWRGQFGFPMSCCQAVGRPSFVANRVLCTLVEAALSVPVAPLKVLDRGASLRMTVLMLRVNDDELGHVVEPAARN